jgi:hypothetical protein
MNIYICIYKYNNFKKMNSKYRIIILFLLDSKLIRVSNKIKNSNKIKIFIKSLQLIKFNYA